MREGITAASLAEAGKEWGQARLPARPSADEVFDQTANFNDGRVHSAYPREWDYSKLDDDEYAEVAVWSCLILRATSWDAV